MGKKIAIVVIVLIVCLLIVVQLQPAQFTVTRSATVMASPAKVFGIVNNIRRWNEWSPWHEMEPTAKTSYSGPATGVGASQSWEGKKTGAGTMTMVVSRPNSLIEYRLDFMKPMKATMSTTFALKPMGKDTEVTWTLNGHRGFVGKLFSLLMNHDKMMGGDFEKGLANLKALVEVRKK